MANSADSDQLASSKAGLIGWFNKTRVKDWSGDKSLKETKGPCKYTRKNNNIKTVEYYPT